MFEYLAARKPIFAVTEQGSAAANLLAECGAHTIAPPDGADSLAEAVRAYVSRWSETGARFEPRPDFDLGAYEYVNLGKKMLDLIRLTEHPVAQRSRLESRVDP